MHLWQQVKHNHRTSLLLPVARGNQGSTSHPWQRLAGHVQHVGITCLVQPAECIGPSEQLRSERGVQFLTGPAFYRAESAQGRDLAVLAASIHKRQHGTLRVLDVMAGSGVRGARYLQQAGATDVWCNDYNSSLHDELVCNLCQRDGSDMPLTPQQVLQQAQQLDQGAHVHVPVGLKRQVWEWQQPSGSASVDGTATAQHSSNQAHTNGDSYKMAVALLDSRTDKELHSNVSDGAAQDSRQPGPRRLRVSHMDAKRLLTAAYLAEDYYDVIDIDSFGSDTSFLDTAIETVKYGGLLYVTSTDGFSSGGRRPIRALAAYGCYTRALPWANEQGLRMLIGMAVQAGASRGVAVTPVFSLYSYHGPVFRVMLRVKRSAEWPAQHYKFAGHCHVHGGSSAVDWQDLGSAVCRCGKHAGANSGVGSKAHDMVLAGPMWTGPLHNREDILSMIAEADQKGWCGHSADRDSAAGPVRSKKSNATKPLQELLQIFLEESDPRLPPGFLALDTLGKYLTSYPPRDKLIAELRAAGHAAARCHVDMKAIRTSATVQQVVEAAATLGIQRRLDCPW